MKDLIGKIPDQIGNLNLNIKQKQRLISLIELLQKWNKTYNLTAIRQPEEMLIKHIFDSLVVGDFLEGENFIDVGTGAGFPGLPLAIAYPEKKFTLLDSLGKRIQFIRNAVRELNLKNVTPVLSRVEEFNSSEKFDGVLSRAFASLSDMTSLCQHLINEQGLFYALKGQNNPQEIKAIHKNFEVKQIIPLKIPNLSDERHLIVIRK